MYLSQLKQGGVICRIGSEAKKVGLFNTVYELAQSAIAERRSLEEEVQHCGLGEVVDLQALFENGELDCPLRHPDSAHMHISGTGLTHLGSASARDAMHVSDEGMSDSMKMFQWGIENGKPESGAVGVQPEWFYKGNGNIAVAATDDLHSPAFALDAGEEPEIAAFYVVGPDGTPYRVGYALSNEFSDHVTEKLNYLFLAHSKLRPISFGAELLVGELPADVRGTSSILRDGEKLWEKPFLSGEENMSHTIANLEHHHFKYKLFRQPGDVQVHVFGTATLSVVDGISCQAGDVYDIRSDVFGLPLKNTLVIDAPEHVDVVSL